MRNFHKTIFEAKQKPKNTAQTELICFLNFHQQNY